MTNATNERPAGWNVAEHGLVRNMSAEQVAWCEANRVQVENNLVLRGLKFTVGEVRVSARGEYRCWQVEGKLVAIDRWQCWYGIGGLHSFHPTAKAALKAALAWRAGQERDARAAG